MTKSLHSDARAFVNPYNGLYYNASGQFRNTIQWIERPIHQQFLQRLLIQNGMPYREIGPEEANPLT